MIEIKRIFAFFKELIQKLKVANNHVLMRDQAVQLGLKNKEIAILTKQNKHLRQQISELRQQLEVSCLCGTL